MPHGPLDHARSSARTSTPATAYLAIDRHRNDDLKPYLFSTTDYGETWKPLAGNLPDGGRGRRRPRSRRRTRTCCSPARSSACSSRSTAARSWHHLDKTGLPTAVRVHDLVIHPRDRELVIGTHGRGIWVMDIAPLEQTDRRRCWRPTRTCSTSSR